MCLYFQQAIGQAIQGAIRKHHNLNPNHNTAEILLKVMLNTIYLALLGTLHFLESPASCIGFTKINNTIQYVRFFIYFI
jgi:hypothetical protein